jgi:hypothetical protein
MNTKASHWHKIPFPLYDDIHFLVHGVVATGAGAFHVGSHSVAMAWQAPQAPANCDVISSHNQIWLTYAA